MKALAQLLWLWLSATALAAPVTGVVRLANGKPARHAVVWFEGERKSKPLARFVVDQRDKQFIPHVSVATVGTTISFPNHDVVYHNVFAEFDAKRFDLGMYPKGATRTERFDKPGLVAVFCSVHSSMSAYVMIVDTPFYAITNAQGEFRVEDVPDGPYLLKTWHESGEKASRKVDLGERRLQVDLSRK